MSGLAVARPGVTATRPQARIDAQELGIRVMASLVNENDPLTWLRELAIEYRCKEAGYSDD